MRCIVHGPYERSLSAFRRRKCLPLIVFGLVVPDAVHARQLLHDGVQESLAGETTAFLGQQQVGMDVDGSDHVLQLGDCGGTGVLT